MPSPRRRWLSWGALAALALIGAVRVQERRAATAWLALAEQAPRNLVYQGVQTTTAPTGEGAATLRVRVTHEAPDRTRTEYLDGDLAGTVVVAAGGQQWRHDPRLRRTITAPTPPPQPADLRGYRLRVRRGEPVAGRPTVVVTLRATDRVRRLWIDQQTGLILRSEAGPTEQRVTTSFAELAYGYPAQAVSFALPSGLTETFTEACGVAECARRVGVPVAEPTWVPRGYRFASAGCYHCPCGCGMLAAHLLYTNGVGWISVFEQDRRHAGCVLSGDCRQHGEAAHRCVMAAGSGVVARVDRQPMVIVLGDVAPAVLARVADSVPAEGG